jgi:hypothetical protein
MAAARRTGPPGPCPLAPRWAEHSGADTACHAIRQFELTEKIHAYDAKADTG